MTEDITVMTWNTNGEGGIAQSTIHDQINFLDRYHQDTDLFLLQAVNYAKEGDEEPSHFQQLKDYFEDRDYHIADTRDWAHQLLNLDVQPYHNISGPFKRCKITASNWSIDRKPLDLRNEGNWKPEHLNYFYASFLTGPFVSNVHHPAVETTDNEGLEVWNTGIIHGSGWKEEKIKALETVYGRIYLQNKQTNKKIILGGDFNAPWKETIAEENGHKEVDIHPHSPDPKHLDKPFYGNPYRYQAGDEDTEEFPFSQRWRNAESYIFDSEKTDWDMKDVYWHADDSLKRDSTDDHTHVVNNGNPPNKRLDHLLADDHFNVKSCEIQNGIDVKANGFKNGATPSDHAPIKARLQIEN